MLSRRCLTWRSRTSTTSASVRSWPSSILRLWAAAMAIRRVVTREASPLFMAARMADSISVWRLIELI